jgi:DNA polymerase-3 subunit delta
VYTEYNNLIKSLEQRKFAPVYFLHGEENFFIDDIADYIEKNALTDSEKSFNQQVLYGRDADDNAIASAARRYPLMSNHQVLIVKEAQTLKKWDALEKYFEKPVESTILVICHKYKTLDKRLKIYKALKDGPAVLFESKGLDEKKVPEFINKYLEERQMRIKPQAANMLKDNLGNDLEKIVNALDKLMNTKVGSEPIDEKDIEQNVGISREYNVTELQRALVYKDMAQLSKIVNYISQNPKEQPLPLILGFFYSFFSKAAAVQLKNSTPKDLGMNDWFFKDYQKASANYPGKIKQILRLLQEYDLRFKGVNNTGTAEGELMKEMVYRILYI